MNVIRFVVENVKKISRVELTPDGKFVVIAGNNEQGKTSFLDSIMYLFCGKGKIPPHVLKDGTESGYVEAIIDDLRISKVVRTFGKDDKSQLIVTGVDGAKQASPQAMVEQLMGGPTISFDPTEFLRMDKKKQVDTLRQLDPDLDFTELDKSIREVYDQRTEVNRGIKGIRSQLEDTPFPDDVPNERVSASELMNQFEEMKAHNEKIETMEEELHQLYEAHSLLSADMKKLQERMDAIIARGSEVKAMLEGAVKADIIPIREQLDSVDEDNARFDLAQKLDALQAELSELEIMATGMTTDINNMEAEKKDKLANATFPVEGLAFTEDGVTMNGLPFDEGHMSGGEMLRVSVAIALAFNQNGILLVRQGALLDSANREMIKEMAAEKDCLVLFESVGDDADAQIVIEDGQVRAG